MAARRNHVPKAPLGNPDQWRKRIQTTALVNRLQDFAIGKLELSQSQVNAINILLKKVLPDLTENKTEHTGSFVIENRPLA